MNIVTTFLFRFRLGRHWYYGCFATAAHSWERGLRLCCLRWIREENRRRMPLFGQTEDTVRYQPDRRNRAPQLTL